MDPSDLLKKLQGIENELGRVKIIDKGPRNIDLDILLYDSIVLKSETLTIPHRLMLEREFVLRPLCEYENKNAYKLNITDLIQLNS